MSSQIEKILKPVFEEYIEITELKIKETKVDNTLIISLPIDLIKIIKKNPKKFYALSKKLNCESLHFVSIDTGVIKKQNNLKVSKSYLKELAKDIVFPQLIHGYFTESSDMGKNEIYNVIVNSNNEELLKSISKAYTKITGMKSQFLVSNRAE